MVLTIESDSSKGWSLGKPRRVAQLSDSDIYILDSDWKRISVHSSTTGELLRTIGNGYGLRPGQFVLPVDMASTDSVLYVLDYELRRVSEFTRAGAYVRTIDLTPVVARRIGLVGDTLWIRYAAVGKYALAALGSDGSVVRTAAKVTRAEQRLGDLGYDGAIVTSEDAIVYVNGDASTIDSVAPSSKDRLSRISEPTGYIQTISANRQRATLPARGVIAATRLANGWLVVLEIVKHRSNDTTKSVDASQQFMLAVYDSNGRGLDTIPLSLNGRIAVGVDAAIADSSSL